MTRLFLQPRHAKKEMEIVNKLSIIFAALVLVACSNPQDPTESNFKSAIQEYYSTSKACFNIRADFPYQLAKSDYAYKRYSEILNELVSIGLLESIGSEKEVKSYFGNKTKEMEPAITYSLSKNGKLFAKVPEKRFMSLGGTEFCYGEYEVAEITNFTEPADFMGQKVSKVSFTYRANKIEGWAKSSQLLQDKFSSVAKDIASIANPIDGNAALILTNNGWVHEKLFKN